MSGYRWRDTPGWNPAANLPPRPARPRLSVAARQEASRANLAAFAGLRAAGASVEEAAELLGVHPRTAKRYAARLKGGEQP